MKQKLTFWTALSFGAFLILGGCSEETTANDDTGDLPNDVDSDSAKDTDSDSDTDTESDGDSETKTGSDSDTDPGWINPGCDAEGNFVREGLTLDIDVDLKDYANGLYTIREIVTVTPTQAGSAVSLFGENLQVLRASAGFHYNTHAATFCVEPFSAGDQVSIEIEYVVDEDRENAIPLPFEIPMLMWGLRGYDNEDGQVVVGPFNEPYYAPFWLFVPQAMGQSNKSLDDNPAVESVKLAVRAPDETWTVVGPGGPAIPENNIWKFSMDVVQPIYAVSFAASPDYETFSVGRTQSGVEVIGAVFPESRPGAEVCYEAAIDTIDWMEEHIGPYAFGDYLTLAEVPEFGGGMEHTSVIWLSSETLTPDDDGDFIVAHEVVHHWWGDNVRFADWPHFWLAESFDEWSTNFNIMELLMEQEAFAARKIDYRIEGAALTFPIADWIPFDIGPLRFDDSDDMTIHFISDLSLYYVYGAAFLEMVHQRLLRDFDTDLIAVLASWFEAKHLQSATTEEFLAFMEDTTGDTQRTYWSALFADWVYKVPCPVVSYESYSFTDGTASISLVRLEEGGDQLLENLEVVFVVGNDHYATTVTLLPDTDHVTATVGSLPAPPDHIVVDPSQFYVFKLHVPEQWSGPEVGFVL